MEEESIQKIWALSSPKFSPLQWQETPLLLPHKTLDLMPFKSTITQSRCTGLKPNWFKKHFLLTWDNFVQGQDQTVLILLAEEAMQTRWFSSIKHPFLRSCIHQRNSWHNFIGFLATFSDRHQVPIFSYRENCEGNLKTSRCPNLMLTGFVSKMLASPCAWRIPLGKMPRLRFTKDFYCPNSLVSTFHRAFFFHRHPMWIMRDTIPLFSEMHPACP